MLNINDDLVRNRGRVLVERHPEAHWVGVRSAILRALEVYPDAREAVVRALVKLRALDEGEGG